MTLIQSRLLQYLILTLLVMAAGESVRAQDTTRRQPATDTIRIRPGSGGRIDVQNLQQLLRNQVRIHRGGGMPQVVEAEQFMSQGNYERAIQILEPLYEEDPDNPTIMSSLKRAYKGVKDYDALQSLIDKQLETSPDDAVLLSELADLHFLAGREEKGEEVIERILEKAPSDPDRYNLAARSYLNNGMYQEGIATYYRGRRELGDSLIFAQELGRLFEARREYAAAVVEHFRYLAASPHSRSVAERRITNLIKVPEAVDQITQAFVGIVSEYPNNEYAHSLYGDLLFESGAIDSAFAEYRRADALSEQEGQHQLKGLKRCLETEHYTNARAEADDFLARYPEHQRSIDVAFVLARAELGLDRPDVAVAMLNELANDIPKDDERARIQLEIGEIYRVHVRDMDSAQAYYRLVVDGNARENDRTTALMRLGDLAVYFGELDRADSIYQIAHTVRPRPDQREEIDFRRAEIELFRQAYDACREELNALVKAHPRGRFVNDALQLSMIIGEGQDAMNWSLNHYADGAYALRRGQDSIALEHFGAIVKDSANGIADEALFEVAQIHTSHAAFDSALADYERLIQFFPESFMVPRAWLAIGDLYAGPLAEASQAREAYQVIISEHKNSPVVEEARLRLQTLGLP
ncbi:MAG: tetratricopeptide repeat protein [candidate division Zixibacteria bacterium]|nr:tetratricopeptide repeat protein [candidate division Zixibacteria bacterium]